MQGEFGVTMVGHLHPTKHAMRVWGDNGSHMKCGMATPDTTNAKAKRKRINDNGDNDNNSNAMIKQITPPTVESPLATKNPTTPRSTPIITPHGSSLTESTISSYTIRKNNDKKPEVSDDIQQQFPALSKYYPEVFHHGRNFIGEIDLDFQLLIISETVALCKMKKEPLQYMHSNGKHGVRLIELPITLSKDGTEVQPNINRFLDEQLLPAININTEKEKAKNDITEVLLEYLMDNSRRQRLMEKLCEMGLVPKVMIEYQVASLLEESGIKV